MSKREFLGIEYIHGRMSAKVIRKGAVIREWTYPEPIIEEEQVADILKLIPSQVDFHGNEVSLVISSPAIDYLVTKTPPMKKRDLLAFLAFKAQDAKGQNHCWAYSELSNSKDLEHTVYIHLLPAVYRDLFLNFCSFFDFTPLHMVTVASIVPRLLDRAVENGNLSEILAVSTGYSTFFVVGKKNQPFFIREVPYTWTSNDSTTLDQLAREVKRTILFAKQQYNAEIATFRICYQGEALTRTIIDSLKMQGTENVIDDLPIDWIHYVSRFSSNATENIVPIDIINRKYTLKRTAISLTFLCFVYLFLISTFIFTTTTQKKVNSAFLEADFSNEFTILEERKGKIDYLQQEISTNNSIKKLLINQRKPPVPGYFLNLAADLLPDELQITRLAVSLDSSSKEWNIEIAGRAPRDPLLSAALLKKYQDTLSASPANLSIVTPWRSQWSENLKTGSTEDASSEGKSFFIAGNLK